MLYSPSPIGNNGARFVLEEGTIGELYDCIEGALKKFYDNQDLNIVSPQKPDFKNFSEGSRRLETHNVEKSREGKTPLKLGRIAMNYFRKTRTRAKKNVDYATSSTFAEEDASRYEALSIFFNTYLVSMYVQDPNKNDINNMREAERNAFLDKLEELVEN